MTESQQRKTHGIRFNTKVVSESILGSMSINDCPDNGSAFDDAQVAGQAASEQ